MDINTKQRPVPSELILDIKKLADTESSSEELMREIYDRFNSGSESPLFGLLSPSERQKGKISRVTFNAALRSIWSVFGDADSDEIYTIFSAYLRAIVSGMRKFDANENIVVPTMFKALALIFPEVARRVADRYGDLKSVKHSENVLQSLFSNSKKRDFSKIGASHVTLGETF